VGSRFSCAHPAEAPASGIIPSYLFPPAAQPGSGATYSRSHLFRGGSMDGAGSAPPRSPLQSSALGLRELGGAARRREKFALSAQENNFSP